MGGAFNRKRGKKVVEGETIQYLAIGEVTPHRRLANLQLKVGEDFDER